MSVETTVWYSEKSMTAASSPIPFTDSGFKISIWDVMRSISPNSPRSPNSVRLSFSSIILIYMYAKVEQTFGVKLLLLIRNWESSLDFQRNTHKQAVVYLQGALQ